jgi:hypothetical protein
MISIVDVCVLWSPVSKQPQTMDVGMGGAVLDVG